MILVEHPSELPRDPTRLRRAPYRRCISRFPSTVLGLPIAMDIMRGSGDYFTCMRLLRTQPPHSVAVVVLDGDDLINLLPRVVLRLLLVNVVELEETGG